MIRNIFHLCVRFLQSLADFFGTDYYTINVVIFCVLVPLVFIAMLILILHYRRAYLQAGRIIK